MVGEPVFTLLAHDKAYTLMPAPCLCEGET
jgi:hypothetical protein